MPPRSPDSVLLLAVSKLQEADKVRQAHSLGLRNFGENYVQEAVAKAAACADLDACVWHLIGPLQANKTAAAAALFDWVHSIDRVKIARRLGAARLQAGLPPINVCVQVNLDLEPTKAGVPAAAAANLCAEIATLAGIRLRGLMCIPQHGLAPAASQACFARLRMVKEEAAQQSTSMDTLSMGMSSDFTVAIAAGATIVRIGTALFGPRPPQ